MSMMREGRNDGSKMPRVICSQLGARDHYAYPRAFCRNGGLEALITDYWHRAVPLVPVSLSARISGRRHADLENDLVYDQKMRSLFREIRYRVGRVSGWDRILARNCAYQAGADKALGRIAKNIPVDQAVILFSYSYAARRLFQSAKRRGWKTILGQIDPGPLEARLVVRLAENWPEYPAKRMRAPERYYDQWRQELDLADRIVVNSDWSREGLLAEGVDAKKLAVVPIPYDADCSPRARSCPVKFSSARPLRLLFLGQINLRKGAAELLEAMVALKDEPVELDLVGNLCFGLPERVRKLRSLRWHGRLPHSQTSWVINKADLFVIPTHSDGFALTQIEMLARGLPVLTSPFCTSVVQDGLNGRVLSEVNVDEIVSSIRQILAEPDLIEKWSANCSVPEGCRMSTVALKLRDVVMLVR
jgi:glycosyltransferase involved in cell wall biosynthesis